MNFCEVIIYIIVIIILICLITITIFFICPYTSDPQTIVKKRRKTITLEELSETAKSGDLLLFSGTDNHMISSDIRKLAFKTEFTHAALLYKNINGELKVWESCTPDKKDARDELTEKYKNGSQLRSLRKIMKGYGGYIVHYPLLPSLEETHSKEKVDRIFVDTFKKYKGYSFDDSPWLGIASIFNSLEVKVSNSIAKFFKRVSKSQSITCPELVIDLYKKFGIWKDSSPKIPLVMYFPHHFVRKGYLGNRILGNGREIVV